LEALKRILIKILPKGGSIMEHLKCFRTATGAAIVSRPGHSRPFVLSTHGIKEVGR
jgi:hypothetical protein